MSISATQFWRFLGICLFVTIQATHAWPTGAGSCLLGQPAVGGSHLTNLPSDGSVIDEGDRSISRNSGFAVYLGTELLTPDSADFSSEAAVGVPYNLTLEPNRFASDDLSFKGFQITLGEEGGSTMGEIRIVNITQDRVNAEYCSIIGVPSATHIDNSPKTDVTVELELVTELEVGTLVPIDITVVLQNSNGVSDYLYSRFWLEAVELEEVINEITDVVNADDPELEDGQVVDDVNSTQAEDLLPNCELTQARLTTGTSPEITFTYYADVTAGVLRGNLSMPALGWMGFAVSTTGNMEGSHALIGLPTLGEEEEEEEDASFVQRYVLGGYSVDLVTPLEVQDDFVGVIVQTDDSTVFEFEISLEDPNNPDYNIDPSGPNFFLFAAGSSNELAYHAVRVSNLVELTPCGDSGTTAEVPDVSDPLPEEPLPGGECNVCNSATEIPNPEATLEVDGINYTCAEFFAIPIPDEINECSSAQLYGYLFCGCTYDDLDEWCNPCTGDVVPEPIQTGEDLFANGELPLDRLPQTTCNDMVSLPAIDGSTTCLLVANRFITNCGCTLVPAVSETAAPTTSGSIESTAGGTCDICSGLASVPSPGNSLPDGTLCSDWFANQNAVDANTEECGLSRVTAVMFCDCPYDGGSFCNTCTGEEVPSADLTGADVMSLVDLPLPDAPLFTCGTLLLVPAVDGATTCNLLYKKYAYYCGCEVDDVPVPTCGLCDEGRTVLPGADKPFPFQLDEETQSEAVSYSCIGMDNILSVQTADGCALLRDALVEDSAEIFDILAYCECPGTEPSNTCGNFCPVGTSIPSDLLELVPGLDMGLENVTLTCQQMNDSMNFYTNSLLCDAFQMLSPLCCTDGIGVSDPSDVLNGADLGGCDICSGETVDATASLPDGTSCEEWYEGAIKLFTIDGSDSCTELRLWGVMYCGCPMPDGSTDDSFCTVCEPSIGSFEAPPIEFAELSLADNAYLTCGNLVTIPAVDGDTTCDLIYRKYAYFCQCGGEPPTPVCNLCESGVSPEAVDKPYPFPFPGSDAAIPDSSCAGMEAVFSVQTAETCEYRIGNSTFDFEAYCECPGVEPPGICGGFCPDGIDLSPEQEAVVAIEASQMTCGQVRDTIDYVTDDTLCVAFQAVIDLCCLGENSTGLDDDNTIGSDTPGNLTGACSIDSDDQFTCEVPNQLSTSDGNVTLVNATVTCDLDPDIGLDIQQSENCECIALLIDQFGPGVERNCSCSVCASGSSTTVSVDCSQSEGNPFVFGSCVGITCDGQCDTTVPDGGVDDGSEGIPLGSSSDPLACSANGERFTCSVPNQLSTSDGNVTLVNATVTCALDAQIGFDIQQSENCECNALLIEQFRDGMERTCSCSVCATGSATAISVDCSQSEESPFVFGSCVGITCEGECNTTVPDDGIDDGSEDIPVGIGSGPTSCTADGNQFTCEVPNQLQTSDGNVTLVNATVTCDLDPLVGLDIQQSENCECNALLIEQFGDGMERNCSCSVCGNGSMTTISVDCSQEENPFVFANCVGITCEGQCDTTLPSTEGPTGICTACDGDVVPSNTLPDGRTCEDWHDAVSELAAGSESCLLERAAGVQYCGCPAPEDAQQCDICGGAVLDSAIELPDARGLTCESLGGMVDVDQNVTCGLLEAKYSVYCGCADPSEDTCNLCNEYIFDDRPYAFPVDLRAAEARVFSDINDYSCNSLASIYFAQSPEGCESIGSDLFGISELDLRAWCGCTDSSLPLSCGELCPDGGNITAGYESFVASDVFTLTCEEWEEVVPYLIDEEICEFLQNDVRPVCCDGFEIQTSIPTISMEPTVGTTATYVPTITPAPTTKPPLEPPTAIGPTSNETLSPTTPQTLPPVPPGTTLMPTVAEGEVRVNTSFVLSNEEGVTANDLGSPENAATLNAAFEAFVAQLVQDVESGQTQRQRSLQHLRSHHRRLEVRLQPNSTRVYGARDIECPTATVNGMPISEKAYCQDVYGSYDLIIVDENPQDVQETYTDETEQAVEDGKMQESIEESNPQTIFIVVGPTIVVTDDSTPAPTPAPTSAKKEEDGGMEWWLILIIVLAALLTVCCNCAIIAYCYYKNHEDNTTEEEVEASVKLMEQVENGETDSDHEMAPPPPQTPMTVAPDTFRDEQAADDEDFESEDGDPVPLSPVDIMEDRVVTDDDDDQGQDEESWEEEDEDPYRTSVTEPAVVMPDEVTRDNNQEDFESEDESSEEGEDPPAPRKSVLDAANEQMDPPIMNNVNHYDASDDEPVQISAISNDTDDEEQWEEEDSDHETGTSQPLVPQRDADSDSDGEDWEEED